MSRFAILLALAVAVAVSGWVGGAEAADVYVNGYTTKNGTVVQPYVRSAPDNQYNNNYSVKPNVNPYTGVPGTLAPTYDNKAPAKSPFGTLPRY